MEIFFSYWSICWISPMAQMLGIRYLWLKFKLSALLISFLDVSQAIHFFRLSPFATASDLGIKNRVYWAILTVSERIILIYFISLKPAILYYLADTLAFGSILFLKHLLDALGKCLQLKTLIDILLFCMFGTFGAFFEWNYSR